MTFPSVEPRVRITSIVGARPQFIKAAAVSRAIAAHNRSRAGIAIEERIVHTGQHYDDNLSDLFFRELEIPRPSHNLAVGSGSHGEQTGRMLERIEQMLLREMPDRVLVYGDTNSTLAGALAAAKLGIPVAHVEAGLRSFVPSMPEEINRVVTDRVCDVLFCPTPAAVTNLAREGISTGVHHVGDVLYDSTRFYSRKAASIEADVLQRLGVVAGSFYLATVHRAENTDHRERLAGIFEAFDTLATGTCPVIVPLHPRTAKCLREHGLGVRGAVRIIEPVSYLEMVAMEKNARRILTDSGGVQKEAFFLHVPCVTLRDETEWVETVDAGWNVLAGANTDAIVAAAQATAPTDTGGETAYGKGDAADRICEVLTQRHAD